MQRSDQPGESGSPTAPELSTEVVHDRLREAILRGELDPRMPISQVQLAARLGVSRTPLREALRMLQREGLIDSPPNRRVRVAELSITDLEQVYASRVLVEALAVRLTVPRYAREDLAELRAALSAMNRPLEEHDIDAWEAEHRRYHELLRRYAGERIERLAQEHAAIVEACESGDGPAVSVQLVRHLARTALMLIALADPEHEPTPVREALRLVTAGDRTEE